MKEQQKQTILDLPKVIAIGISSPVATVLTSRFGVAGTLMGLALSAVILTALADILKVYLARAPATVAKIPGGFPSRFSWRNIRSRSSAAFFRFSALPPARRRSILISTVTAAGISFFVGLSVVTGLEAGVGKSLSCWVWNNCPTESSTDESTASTTSTLPSVLGGGQSARSVAPEIRSSSPRQPTPDAQKPPSHPESVSGPERPSLPQPRQQWSSSGAPDKGDRQPSLSGGSEQDELRSSADEPEEDNGRSPADELERGQQPSSSAGPGEGDRWSPSSDPEKGDRQPSSSGGSEQDELRSPADGSEGGQQKEDQRNRSSGPDLIDSDANDSPQYSLAREVPGPL